ncbi:kynurenine formamidase [Paraburkholderia sp. WSM4179]|nr:kynurenine formamidase [Paraburkholderia sp. WSM4179]
MCSNHGHAPSAGSGEGKENWGRWGRDDERGAANFATAEKLAAAAQLVRTGRAYSLALPLQPKGLPVNPERGVPVHLMSIDAGDFAAGFEIEGGFCTADDYFAMHTQTGTHIDGLGHVWYDEALFNGFPASSVRSNGAARLGIEKLKHLTGRGVLLDVAGYLGVEHLAPTHVITPEELEMCAKSQGTEVGEGDILLVRTGWLGTYRDDNPRAFWSSNPGLGIAAGEWVGAKRVAGIGMDNFAVEVHPSETGFIGPVHKRLIRDFGCFLMELVVLDELAHDKVYEFLFMAAPLPITGGTGSPINPLALC